MRHNNPEVAERLRRFVGARGPATIDTVAPEILPTIVVGDLREEGQGGIILQCYGYVSDSGVAGQYSQLALWNPADSRADLVVQGLIVSNSTGTGYTLSTGNQIIGNIPGRDFQNPSLETFGALYNYTAAAIDPGVRLFGKVRVGAGNSRDAGFEPDGSIRLQPGFGLQAACGTTNATAEMSIHWHEVIRPYVR
jgi:hypothetical protein